MRLSLRSVMNVCAKLKSFAPHGTFVNLRTRVPFDQSYVRTIYTLTTAEVMSTRINAPGREIFTSGVLMKAKNKGKKKVEQLDLRELETVFNSEKLLEEFRRPLEQLKTNFVRQVSLRSSIGAIEELPIKFEGDEYQLQELVQISRKPKLIVLNVDTYPQTMNTILETLRSSQMNLNPQHDKTTIYIPIPKITKEHRERLSKTAKGLFIQCRDKLGEVQATYLKKLQKKEGLPIETCQRIQEHIDTIRHNYIDEAQALLDAKQKELLSEDK